MGAALGLGRFSLARGRFASPGAGAAALLAGGSGCALGSGPLGDEVEPVAAGATVGAPRSGSETAAAPGGSGGLDRVTARAVPIASATP
ncbi:MAG: hypothetical protein DYH12_32780, partial [Sorangiineae bacterium PRO1]|nr:hypothetical protein [Sorangiineae bacterium PRO1]